MEKMKQVNEDFSCEQVGLVNSESIGSDYREYIVNDDIKIHVATNLGFGNCSYFTLRLQYKGVDILPYSSAVNSYYTDMRDVLMCIKKYSPQSESWNLASDFIDSTVNLIKTDAEKFCEKFLKNEIDSMLAGLAKAVEDPGAFLNKFSTRTCEENDPGFITLRTYMNEKEREIFEAYPYEMPVVFMAEKIMNALMLLHNLQSLSAVYPQGYEAIQKIKELATAGVPKIDECISRIIYQLNQLRVAGASEENGIQVEDSEKLNEEFKTRLDFMDVLTDCIDMIENLCDKAN